MTHVTGRCLAPLTAVVLLLAACSSESPASKSAPTSTASVEATTTSIVIGPDGSSTVLREPGSVESSSGGAASVLGVAFRGDAAAIFMDQVRASATPLVGSAGIEAAVVAHEVGHLLGLVDLYLHTGRQDADHPGHSTDKNSVMYWAVESDLVADLLQGGPPQNFDAADIDDLKTINDSG